jgi:hypothetical protein
MEHQMARKIMAHFTLTFQHLPENTKDSDKLQPGNIQVQFDKLDVRGSMHHSTIHKQQPST